MDRPNKFELSRIIECYDRRAEIRFILLLQKVLSASILFCCFEVGVTNRNILHDN